ncbi:DUF1707 SHOCT-like domain-containing protein [Amycolatopsis sp. CA-230715]|uniref:DUF1707 SHOCT-like domain-containing protein n=1 Tax=Amycolatopsis sp. CA-230715 TaxID=2745196 RepID=UPI001C0265F6|nr:DUF1707 domain-containing protein [Amycolatopsis sp. CA-230715]
MTEDPLRLRASDADRERVAQALYHASGTGQLTLDELEDRLAHLYAAKTLVETEAVVADLQTRPVAAAEPAQGPKRSFAVLSGVDRRGEWTLPPRHRAVAFWGGATIDLRYARLISARTRISAFAIMGGIEIIAPEDLTVEVGGTGLMGGFRTARRSRRQAAPPGAPVVVVSGLAFWGSVKVVRKTRKERRR